MTILLILAAVTVLGFVLIHWRRAEALGVLLTVTGFSVLAMTVLPIPFFRMASEAKIQEYKAVRATFDASRSNGETLENAAIQMKIAEQNQWRASVVYWNDSVFDIWIVDEVDTLEPIQ